MSCRWTSRDACCSRSLSTTNLLACAAHPTSEASLRDNRIAGPWRGRRYDHGGRAVGPVRLAPNMPRTAASRHRCDRPTSARSDFRCSAASGPPPAIGTGTTMHPTGIRDPEMDRHDPATHETRQNRRRSSHRRRPPSPAQC
jgi:hypothetical protein